jgi:prepilin-type N-terminal cleavage/methylation domain-containing protein
MGRDLRRGDDGFTMAELMVVVLIIGILLTATFASLNAARRRSQDRAAQSSLVNAVTAAKVVYTDASDYTRATANGNAAVSKVEPSLTFKPNASPSVGPNDISLKAPNAATLYAAAFSDAGKCWYARDVQSSTSPAGMTWAVAANVTQTACTADSASSAAVFVRNPGSA